MGNGYLKNDCRSVPRQFKDWETKDGAIGGGTGEEPGGLSDADTNVKCLNTV